MEAKGLQEAILAPCHHQISWMVWHLAQPLLRIKKVLISDVLSHIVTRPEMRYKSKGSINLNIVNGVFFSEI